jgi:hypothetical protein
MERDPVISSSLYNANHKSSSWNTNIWYRAREVTACEPCRLVPDIKSDSLEMQQYIYCADLISGSALI